MATLRRSLPGQALSDVIKLELSDEVDIDTSRDIA